MGHGGTECEIHERRNDRVNEGRERKDDARRSSRPSERVSKSEPRNHLNQGMNIHPRIHCAHRRCPLSFRQMPRGKSVCQCVSRWVGLDRIRPSAALTTMDLFVGTGRREKVQNANVEPVLLFLLLSIQPAGQASHTRSHMRTQLKPKTLRPQSSH